MAVTVSGAVLAPKPWCPFCRSGDLHVVEVINDFRAIAVECQRCGNTAVLAYPPVVK